MRAEVNRGIRVHVFHFPLEFKKFGEICNYRHSHEITEAIETKITLAVRRCPQIPVNTRKAEESWKVSIQQHYFFLFLNIHSRMASFHQPLELLFLVHSALYCLFIGYRNRCWHSRTNKGTAGGQVQNCQANLYPIRVIEHKVISYSITLQLEILHVEWAYL